VLRPARPVRDLVLVGGGHAHVQVLRRWMMAPMDDVRVSIVLDRPVAVYSGMVPGVVAGQYPARATEIDVWTLARRAGVRVVDAAATGLDLDAQRVRLDGRPPLPFDTLSLDVGSTVAGLDTPGVREHAIPTRPIGRFVERMEAAMATVVKPRVLVVGGGAGGVEVAFTLAHRTGGVVTLLDAGATLLPGWTPGLFRRVAGAAARRGITIRTNARVASVEPGRAVLADGDTLPFDLLVWVTGAAPHAWLRDTGLPLDGRGFVRIGPTLQVEDNPALFAVGDCASLTGNPLPKAGVYAVRQGPLLADNLRARLSDGAVRPYRPQKGFLTLLNLGDGTAIGAKGALAFEGAWVWRWKDRIDRAFMERFQVLGDDDAPTAAFPVMAEREMMCGGCAAKVGPGELGRALGRLDVPQDPSVEVGLARPDDAAVVVTPGGDRVGLTVDAFTAFCEDPWLVGRVAAVNAVNDLYAKGMTPRWALALVGIPDEGPRATEDTLYQVMSGARVTLDALGVTLVGGHTLRTADLQIGFSVTGLADGPLRLLGGLVPGDKLVLTRALGSGVLFYANAAARARGAWVQAAQARMVRSHRDASAVAARFGARAATDITGFGLAGHLGEMLRDSGVAAILSLDALPLLPGVETLLRQGLRSTFHGQNAAAGRATVRLPADPRGEVLFDPQTAGGLLVAFPASVAHAAVAALRDAGERDSVVIGDVVPGNGTIDVC
jgi:selenide,water dikinase